MKWLGWAELPVLLGSVYTSYSLTYLLGCWFRHLVNSSMAWLLLEELLMGKQSFWVSAHSVSAVPQVHWIEASQHIIFCQDFFLLASEGSCMCKLILQMF